VGNGGRTRPLLIERAQIHLRIQVDITALEHPNHCQIQNAKIKEYRLMLRIPDVERKPLIPRKTISPIDLSPPCDTRPDRMSEGFALAVIGQIFG
jgi:hypothetical protein